MRIDPIDEVLLKQFMEQFYRYGNYKSDIWLVGMEEGGGKSIQEVSRRINIWQNRGGNELDDLAEYHADLGMEEFFQYPVTLQSTWAGLIRIILVLEGIPTSDKRTHSYQAKRLGRRQGKTCLVELMPLPSPGLRRWIYGKASSNPDLIDRQTYLRQIAPGRAEHIRSRIQEYLPRLVIFYGASYMKWWQSIAGEKFTQHRSSIYLAGGNPVQYALI